MQALQKQQLRVRRQGKVFTVFVDSITDRPMSINSFDDEPAGGFPKIMDEGQILALFGPRYDIVPVDPPAAPKQVEVDGAVDEAALLKVIEAGDKEAAARRKQLGLVSDGRDRRLAEKRGEVPPAIVAAPIPPTPSSPQTTNTLVDLSLKVFQELETLFAKRSVASGKRQKELSLEVNAICNFLLRVDPNIQPALVALSERHKHVARIEF